MTHRMHNRFGDCMKNTIGNDNNVTQLVNCPTNGRIQRYVPEVNFVIHSVHCSRNLKICQQCKEPVAISDMEKHTAQVKCKCGETMQACDMSSHKTDACRLTEIQCSFCELMLCRGDMADHEMYCGSRSEVCPVCSESILIKYKKIHEESNHNFFGLDDEPGPKPSWKIAERQREKIKANAINTTVNKKQSSKSTITSTGFKNDEFQYSTYKNDSFEPNDNITSSTSRGAIKKRIAPQPPINHLNSNNNSQNFDKAPYYEAALRKQKQESQMKEENRLRMENNLPPILTTAEKVEKLRKLSALNNMELNFDRPQKSTKEHSEFGNSKPLIKNVNIKTDKNNKHEVNKLKNNKCENTEYSVGNYSQSGKLYNSPNNELCAVDDGNIADFNERDSRKVAKKKKNSNVKNVNFETSIKDKRIIDASVKPIKILGFNHESGEFVHEGNINVLDELNFDHNSLNTDSIDENRKKICSENSTRNNQSQSKKVINKIHEDLTVVPERAASSHMNIDRFSEIKNDLRALRKELKNCSSPLESRKLPSKLDDHDIKNASNAETDPIHIYKLSDENIASSIPENQPSNTTDEDIAILPDTLLEATNNYQDELEFVLLPCEFCGGMVKASTLVTHETGCRPSITSYPDINLSSQNNTAINKGKRKSSKSSSDNIKNPSNVSLICEDQNNDFLINDLDEVKIPCEFCMSLIPASRLVWHQQACYTS